MAVRLWGREPKSNMEMWCGSWRLYRTDGTLLPLHLSPMAISLQQGCSFKGEEMVIEQADGTRRVVEVNPTAIFDDSNNVIGGVNMMVDITERKATESRIAHLAAIVQYSDDAIISKTLNGVVTSWNEAAERIFGYTAAEMIGESITRIIPEERISEEHRILTALRKGERIDHFETQRMAKSKQLVDVSITVSPVKDSRGNIIGASKIVRDISDRKQNERLLRQNQERLRQLLGETTEKQN